MGIEYRRGSRKVSSRQFFDGMKADIVNSAEAEIEKRLKAIRDPETGKRVKVTKRRVNGEASFNVEGSPAAIELAKQIMKE